MPIRIDTLSGLDYPLQKDAWHPILHIVRLFATLCAN